MHRRLGGVEGRSLITTFIKVLIASLLMGAICWFTSQAIESRLGTESLIARLIDVGVSVALGIGAFFTIARLLKVGEMEQMTSSLKRKFLRKK